MEGGLVHFLYTYPELLLAVACILLFYIHHNLAKDSAAPVNWPLVGMLPAALANLDRLHGWATDVLAESGCTFQFRTPYLLAMDYIATCDPANVNHVFNVNFANYPKGDDFSEIFDVLGDGIFNADDESWRAQRKKAHGVIGRPEFRAFVARCSRDKVRDGLIPLLSQVADQGVVVDLQDVFLRLTFDLTCSLVFGVDPGGMSPELPTIAFARAMDDAMEAVLLRHLPASWWKSMRWLGVGKERKLAEARRVIDRFVAENIARKREGKYHNGLDLVTTYMEDSKEEDEKFLRDTTVNFMLAGRDTTGVALSWLFWLLAENPAAKARILDELDDHGLMEKEVFEYEEIAKLVYLHAAMLECLRLFPPVPFEHKGALRPEVLPSGHPVRAGTKVLFCSHAMGRMEGVWGEDGSEFRPERWITERGRLRHVPAYKFLSFNCGPRTCLGKEIAFTQMKTAAAAMVRNFDVELVEGHVVEPKISIILHMKNGLKVRIKKRT